MRKIISEELKAPSDKGSLRFSCKTHTTVLTTTVRIAGMLYAVKKAAAPSAGLCCPRRIRTAAAEPAQNSSEESSCFPRDFTKKRGDPATADRAIPKNGPQKGISAAERIHNGLAFSISAAPAQAPASSARI